MSGHQDRASASQATVTAPNSPPTSGVSGHAFSSGCRPAGPSSVRLHDGHQHPEQDEPSQDQRDLHHQQQQQPHSTLSAAAAAEAPSHHRRHSDSRSGPQARRSSDGGPSCQQGTTSRAPDAAGSPRAAGPAGRSKLPRTSRGSNSSAGGGSASTRKQQHRRTQEPRAIPPPPHHHQQQQPLRGGSPGIRAAVSLPLKRLITRADAGGSARPRKRPATGPAVKDSSGGSPPAPGSSGRRSGGASRSQQPDHYGQQEDGQQQQEEEDQQQQHETLSSHKRKQQEGADGSAPAPPANELMPVGALQQAQAGNVGGSSGPEQDQAAAADTRSTKRRAGGKAACEQHAGPEAAAAAEPPHSPSPAGAVPHGVQQQLPQQQPHASNPASDSSETLVCAANAARQPAPIALQAPIAAELAAAEARFMSRGEQGMSSLRAALMSRLSAEPGVGPLLPSGGAGDAGAAAYSAADMQAGPDLATHRHPGAWFPGAPPPGRTQVAGGMPGGPPWGPPAAAAGYLPAPPGDPPGGLLPPPAPGDVQAMAAALGDDHGLSAAVPMSAEETKRAAAAAATVLGWMGFHKHARAIERLMEYAQLPPDSDDLYAPGPLPAGPAAGDWAPSGPLHSASRAAPGATTVPLDSGTAAVPPGLAWQLPHPHDHGSGSGSSMPRPVPDATASATAPPGQPAKAAPQPPEGSRAPQAALNQGRRQQLPQPAVITYSADRQRVATGAAAAAGGPAAAASVPTKSFGEVPEKEAGKPRERWGLVHVPIRPQFAGPRPGMVRPMAGPGRGPSAPPYVSHHRPLPQQHMARSSWEAAAAGSKQQAAPDAGRPVAPVGLQQQQLLRGSMDVVNRALQGPTAPHLPRTGAAPAPTAGIPQAAPPAATADQVIQAMRLADSAITGLPPEQLPQVVAAMVEALEGLQQQPAGREQQEPQPSGTPKEQQRQQQQQPRASPNQQQQYSRGEGGVEQESPRHPSDSAPASAYGATQHQQVREGRQQQDGLAADARQQSHQHLPYATHSREQPQQQQRCGRFLGASFQQSTGLDTAPAYCALDDPARRPGQNWSQWQGQPLGRQHPELPPSDPLQPPYDLLSHLQQQQYGRLPDARPLDSQQRASGLHSAAAAPPAAGGAAGSSNRNWQQWQDHAPRHGGRPEGGSALDMLLQQQAARRRPESQQQPPPYLPADLVRQLNQLQAHRPTAAAGSGHALAWQPTSSRGREEQHGAGLGQRGGSNRGPPQPAAAPQRGSAGPGVGPEELRLESLSDEALSTLVLFAAALVNKEGGQ